MRIQLNCFPGGLCKAVTMSYDDGVVDDRRLVELFNRYGLKGTFHLNSGLMDDSRHVPADEIKTLYAGHEVSAHSVTHPFLDKVPPERVVMELMEDRRNLERLVGYPVRGMSYPFGTYNDAVVSALPTLGIEYARTTRSTGTFDLPDNPLLWGPTCHHKSVKEYAEKFVTEQQLPNKIKLRLLYVWGHSYEFDRDNNWIVIEDACRLLSAQDDIWFATNAQIIGYMNALRRLQFSVDGTIVHNPSAIPVWVRADATPVELAPGVVTSLV